MDRFEAEAEEGACGESWVKRVHNSDFEMSSWTTAIPSRAQTSCTPPRYTRSRSRSRSHWGEHRCTSTARTISASFARAG